MLCYGTAVRLAPSSAQADGGSRDAS